MPILPRLLLSGIRLLVLLAPALSVQAFALGCPVAAQRAMRGPGTLAAGAGPPDIVVVVADDVSWSDLDGVPTPELDALAAQGTSFRRAYAFPVCVPTRYSLLFGRTAWRERGHLHQSLPLGFTSYTFALAPLARVSVPEMLAPLGYTSAGFGKWHLGVHEKLNALPVTPPQNPAAVTPLLQGFDTWRAGLFGGQVPDYFLWMRMDDGVLAVSTEYTTTAILDEFAGWWGATAGPRFAYVSLNAPHAPFHVPPAEYLPVVPPPTVTARERYEAMVMSTDHALGKVLDEVDLSQTYLFFLGDNGTPPGAVATGQDPAKVKATTFEGGINVPLIVAGPGVTQGVTSQSLVSSVDLMATLSHIAAGVQEGADSISFLPELGDPLAESRSYVFSANFGAGVTTVDVAVVSPTHKLRFAGLGPELYDLVADPTESSPLNLAVPANLAIFNDLLDKLQNATDRARFLAP